MNDVKLNLFDLSSGGEPEDGSQIAAGNTDTFKTSDGSGGSTVITPRLGPATVCVAAVVFVTVIVFGLTVEVTVDNVSAGITLLGLAWLGAADALAVWAAWVVAGIGRGGGDTRSPARLRMILGRWFGYLVVTAGFAALLDASLRHHGGFPRLVVVATSLLLARALCFWGLGVESPRPARESVSREPVSRSERTSGEASTRQISIADLALVTTAVAITLAMVRGFRHPLGIGYWVGLPVSSVALAGTLAWIARAGQTPSSGGVTRRLVASVCWAVTGAMLLSVCEAFLAPGAAWGPGAATRFILPGLYYLGVFVASGGTFAALVWASRRDQLRRPQPTEIAGNRDGPPPKARH